MKNKFKTLIKKIKQLGISIKGVPTVIDLVCGLEITDDLVATEYKGKKYYFCSEGCRSEFEAYPDKFIG